MRRLLGLLIAVAALFGVARADPLAPPAFTQLFLQALTDAMPSSTVTVKGDLELEIRDPNGVGRTVHLANAYKDYLLDPTGAGWIVHTLAAAMLQSGKDQAGVDRLRIVPVIKDRQWLLGLQQTLKARGVEQEHLWERLNDELVIVYAEDDPTRMSYLTTQDDIGVSREELRALAVDNLRRMLPKIEMRSNGEVLLISAGGDYETSLLLIDEIWSGGQVKVNGDIVVAVPARDVLLVTGSRNPAGVKQLRELAAKFAAEGPYGLTDTLFVYRNGQFAKFGRQ